MHVTVDADLCEGHGECISLADEVFELTEEGKAIVILENPPEAQWRNTLAAATLCPANAIRVTE